MTGGRYVDNAGKDWELEHGPFEEEVSCKDMDYFVACLSLAVPVLLLFACVADGRPVTVEHVRLRVLATPQSSTPYRESSVFACFRSDGEIIRHERVSERASVSKAVSPAPLLSVFAGLNPSFGTIRRTVFLLLSCFAASSCLVSYTAFCLSYFQT